ncbi:MAG: TonB-dependent receptor [Gammaproteobacteria bacterium]|nr:TonB-dependent receptor [Gammaproteobacteria bacterium]
MILPGYSYAEYAASVAATDTTDSLSGATQLPEVVVTGSRLGSEPTLTLPSLQIARQRITLTPGGANIVDAEDYKTGRATTLQDALGFAPGVFVQPRFGAEEARLSIRGSGIQRTFHMRGIKLLQDGIPLNLADGGGDFQAVEPLSARYIEVYRGANALAYGSTTLGGAVNFVSPSGYDASPVQARLEAGSFGYLRGQASFSGVRDDSDYYVSLSHFSQDGFRDHAQQNNQRLFGHYGSWLTDQLESRFYVALVNTDSELPGNLTKAEMNANPRQSATANVTNNFKRDFTLMRVSNKTTYQWQAQRLEATFFYSWKDLFHPIFQVLDIVSQDYGAELRYISEAPLMSRKNILTVGFSPTRGTAEDDRFQNVGGQRGARTNESLQTSSNLDLYAENQHYVQPRLALIAGAQWSHASRKLQDKFLSDGTDNSVDKDYTGFSPKLGARYEITPAAQLFANVSRSFEPPSFGELSGGPTVTAVREQTATTWEIGTRGHDDGMDWEAAYYRASVKDELFSLNDSLGNSLGTINAASTRHQGVEIGLNVQLLHKLNLRQTYLWNDFRFHNDPVYRDNDLAGIPRHFYRADLIYNTPDGHYFGPNVEWSPQKYAVDHANTLFADAYALLGFKLGYRTKQGFSWFVEGKNLTDEISAATTGVIANAAGADSRQFLPGDGRSVFAGIEWRM